MRPAAVNQDMMMELRRRLGNVVGLAVVVQVAATFQAMGSGERAFASGGVIIVGAPILVFVYTVVPLGFFPRFAKFDKLSDAERLNTVVDGVHVKFCDVTAITGFDTPPYQCPILAKGSKKDSRIRIVVARDERRRWSQIALNARLGQRSTASNERGQQRSSKWGSSSAATAREASLHRIAHAPGRTAERVLVRLGLFERAGLASPLLSSRDQSSTRSRGVSGESAPRTGDDDGGSASGRSPADVAIAVESGASPCSEPTPGGGGGGGPAAAAAPAPAEPAECDSANHRSD
jgi:hypothetical protein